MSRIDEICSLIRPCGVLADIGCDHGKVTLRALSLGVDRAIAADKRSASLDKAKRLLSGRSNVSFALSDGFDNIGERVDQAVLAGLGGRETVRILSRIDYRPALVLGPQHGAAELRRFITANGWAITADRCYTERGKFYFFIRAEEGESEPLTPMQEEFGVFYRSGGEALALFAAARIERLSGFAPSPRRDRLIEECKEAALWLP